MSQVCFPYTIVEPSPLVADPIANVTFKNKADPAKLVNLDIYVDTGAFITLLPKSFATLLGLNLASGIKLTLYGVGGGKLTTYVHLLTCELASGIEIDLPAAIADVDYLGSPLFGNLGAWDQIGQLSFDNTLMKLCFSNVTFKDQTATMQWLQQQSRILQVEETVSNIFKLAVLVGIAKIFFG